MCKFCENFDFFRVGVKIEHFNTKTHANIYFAGGNNKIPVEELFLFCPMCGKSLQQEKRSPKNKMTKRLEELAKADSEGRLVELPIKAQPKRDVLLEKIGLTEEEIKYALQYLPSEVSYVQLYRDVEDCGHNCELSDRQREDEKCEEGEEPISDREWGNELCREPEAGFIELPTGRVLEWG